MKLHVFSFSTLVTVEQLDVELECDEQVYCYG